MSEDDKVQLIAVLIEPDTGEHIAMVEISKDNLCVKGGKTFMKDETGKRLINASLALLKSSLVLLTEAEDLP